MVRVLPRIHRPKMHLSAVGMLLITVMTAAASEARAQSRSYTQLRQEILERRLVQFEGSNARRGATIRRLFEEAGCTGASLGEQKAPQTPAPNVICTLRGASEDVIVIGAHFDRAPNSDGVADNWSGASLLPSLFESLQAADRRHTFVFVSFTGEEAGFLGSTEYVNRLTEEKLSRIKAMVNLDTLGLGPTQVWVSDSDPALVEHLGSLAGTMKLPVREMNVDGVGDSDGRPFKRRKVPVITIHSATMENFQILHTPKDNREAIKLTDYYDSYKLIAAYLVKLDLELAPPSATGPLPISPALADPGEVGPLRSAPVR